MDRIICHEQPHKQAHNARSYSKTIKHGGSFQGAVPAVTTDVVFYVMTTVMTREPSLLWRSPRFYVSDKELCCRLVCPKAMDDNIHEKTMDPEDNYPRIDVNRSRYPYCIVWTPIPVLT